jgi:hypothetical protein
VKNVIRDIARIKRSQKIPLGLVYESCIKIVSDLHTTPIILILLNVGNDFGHCKETTYDLDYSTRTRIIV